MQLEMSDLVSILNRIRALEEKVSILEAQLKKSENDKSKPLERPPFPVGSISEKYKRLAEYLYENWSRTIELSYEKIEEILGFTLPPTAYNLPQAYWANTKTHSYASSWLEIGYKAKPFNKYKVIFERNLYVRE